MKEKDSATLIVALGGLGEVGKNMYAFMHKNELYIIDAGVMFPEEELLGVDYVIQDTSFLKENEDKIKGLIITHGHEDHIGGISFLIQNVKIPKIYAPKIAIDLINKKLEDRDIAYKDMVVINEDYVIKSKYFNIEFVCTTHSIPDSFAVCLHTPNGTIFETGDYKFDLTPIGPMANLHKMAKIGSDGVKLLMSDSTNSLSLTDMTAALVTLENDAMPETPNAIRRFTILAPSAATIAMAKRINGHAMKTSMIRMITLSTFPP